MYGGYREDTYLVSFHVIGYNIHSLLRHVLNGTKKNNAFNLYNAISVQFKRTSVKSGSVKMHMSAVT